VFSNAALHWMLDASAVAKNIAQALKSGGRFVAELGGKGNIRHIEHALRAVLPSFYDGRSLPLKTYFPSVGEYAAILEAVGLEVRMAQLFDRPTPLDGEQGMENWLRQFSWYNFEPVPAKQRAEAIQYVVNMLRDSLYRDGRWSADYRRLRIVAVKA
jgi:trans-aconitate methyltransferase